MKTSLSLATLLSLSLLSIFSLRAVDAPSGTAGTTPEASKAEPIPGSYRVLNESVAFQSGQKITYKLITPPQLPKLIKPSPALLTPEEQALADSRQGKAHSQLSVGATVYDHEVTEVHWITAGKQHIAYSNIDFNLVAGIGTFDTTDTVYSVFLAVGNTKRETGVPPVQMQNPQAGSLSHIPALTEFPTDLAVYLVPSDDVFTEADKAILTALDDLHAYYDANREKLQQAHLEREQKRSAQEQWNLNHPPVQKPEEVIYLWKKAP